MNVITIPKVTDKTDARFKFSLAQSSLCCVLQQDTLSSRLIKENVPAWLNNCDRIHNLKQNLKKATVQYVKPSLKQRDNWQDSKEAEHNAGMRLSSS